MSGSPGGAERLRTAAARLEEIAGLLRDPGTSEEGAVELAREAAELAAEAGSAVAQAERSAAEAGEPG